MMKYDELLDCEELGKMAIYSCIWLRDVRTHLEGCQSSDMWGSCNSSFSGFDPFPYSIDFNRFQAKVLGRRHLFSPGVWTPIFAIVAIGFFGGPSFGSPNDLGYQVGRRAKNRMENVELVATEN